MVALRPLVLAAALLLAACEGSEPGSRVEDAGTGGASSTGGAAGGNATGGAPATGGASTLTGGAGGTGGAVATGGSSSTGGAGTGGAPAVAMCTNPGYTGSNWPSVVTDGWFCRATIKGNWMTLRFTADGKACGMCKDVSTKEAKPIVGCMLTVPEARVQNVVNPPKADVMCVASCDVCPVVKCYSTGGDYGTEYPCP